MYKRQIKRYIKSWEEVDEQIITVELNKNDHHIVVIGVYAPSDDANITIKDNFYGKLTTILTNIKDDKEVFILGDLNGRTGREDNNSVVGKYGESATNDNGMRLRSWCETMSLKMMNGYFPYKDIHKFT